jgi:GDSL-like Lipase/Acylhydrolase family
MADVILNRGAASDSETTERPTREKAEGSSSRSRRELSTLFLTLLLAMAGELLLRFRHGRLTDWSRITFNVAYAVSQLPTAYDSELGYVPRPGASNFGPDRVNVDDNGLRKNGSLMTPPGPPILAVGDSFTWGSQVGDDQSWPAHLEQMLGRRVLNAGVNGYGVDQIVMRAERLVPIHRPVVVVVAIIGDDIKRCAYAYRHRRWRPYYTVNGDSLELHNVPIPREAPALAPKSGFRNLLRHSYLADYFLKRLAPEWWLLDEGTLQVHRDDERVAILLMDRLASLQRLTGVPILFVVERATPVEVPHVRRVIARAKNQGLQVLDVSETVLKLSKRSAGTPEAFSFGLNHLTSLGNRWVADRIAEKLREMGVVPAP